MAAATSWNPIDWMSRQGWFGTTPQNLPTGGSTVLNGDPTRYAQPTGDVQQPGYSRPQPSHDRPVVHKDSHGGTVPHKTAEQKFHRMGKAHKQKATVPVKQTHGWPVQGSAVNAAAQAPAPF